MLRIQYHLPRVLSKGTLWNVELIESLQNACSDSRDHKDVHVWDSTTPLRSCTLNRSLLYLSRSPVDSRVVLIRTQCTKLFCNRKPKRSISYWTSSDNQTEGLSSVWCLMNTTQVCTCCCVVCTVETAACRPATDLCRRERE